MKKLVYFLLLSSLFVSLIEVNKAAAKGRNATTQSIQTSVSSVTFSNSNDESRGNSTRQKDSSVFIASTGTKGSGRSSKSRKSTSGSSSSNSKETVSNDSLTLLINEAILKRVKADVNPGNLRVNQVKPDDKSRSVKVQLSESFTYLPVNRELINRFERTVKDNLPDSISNYKVQLNVGSRAYSSYISSIDKLPEKNRKNIPFVYAANPYVHAVKGMEGDIVAMWHSHGRYYKPGAGWAWQRPFLFQTAEDIYTMSYVLPFLTPMLENAGAYVMLPRERDININEVIVDNDLNPEGEIYSQTTYKESNGSKKWEEGELEGFIYDIPNFRDTENPFENGTYRQVETIKSGNFSVAGWYADIPEDGEYAVYVSYKTLPNSTEDAHYTVNFSGGSRDFIVNQTMGGGTWIYLGTFPFESGYSDSEPVVKLTNRTEKGSGKIVTADAIKIGGGKGNIERSAKRGDVTWGTEVVQPTPTVKTSQKEINDDDEDEDIDGEDLADNAEEATPPPTPKKSSGPAPKFSTSGLPRFLEGARYWLHWAGFPESVYSGYKGTDDYKDDYTSRGKWVNYLAGGSRVLPDRKGLNIPVDISFALHTDAGKRNDDTFVGTLGIYYTDGGKNYPDGTPKNMSRIMTDMIMRQVVGDIRQTFEPNWTRRSMWDKSYAEAHTPEVPATLLELLSHQNFADMVYGLDPTFRFTVSRAIYKAMGRFISQRKDREFIVQPLPVESFAITKVKNGEYRLSWEPTEDPLEPTAKPTKYVVMERTEGNLGFNKIGDTKNTYFDVRVKDNKIHSFYIIAANDGGISFPSETLALREGPGEPVLIVNGFTRVSGPPSFASGGRAGFKSDEDFGVPYKYDISFSGYQNEFSRGAGDRFGKSGDNHVTTVVGGNTFDYPAVHGQAIAGAGRGFVSTSLMAVEEQRVKLTNYKTVDLILGKQKRTVVGNGKSGVKFEAFPAFLQDDLDDFVDKGGHLIISGQNIVSELYSDKAPKGSKDFAEFTLGIAQTSPSKSRSGKVKVSGLDRNRLDGENIAYSNYLQRKNYIVEHAEVLKPAEDADATPFMKLSDTGEIVGMTVREGKAKITLMTIPLESFENSFQMSELMKSILAE